MFSEKKFILAKVQNKRRKPYFPSCTYKYISQKIVWVFEVVQQTSFYFKNQKINLVELVAITQIKLAHGLREFELAKVISTTKLNLKNSSIVPSGMKLQI